MENCNKDKSEKYAELVKESQKNYREHPDDYRDGKVELLPSDLTVSVVNGEAVLLDKGEAVSFCKEINLYTYWQGLGYAKSTPKIKYLLVAQDFGNAFNVESQLIKNIFEINTGKTKIQYLDGVDYVKGETDDNLIQLFEVLGYTGDKRIDKMRHNNLFFTNFSLGYRKGRDSGSMSANLMMKDSKYFKRLCDILEPQYILCLGRLTFECVYETLFGQSPKNLQIDNYNEFIETRKEYIYKSDKYTSHIFPLAHCGSMGTMNRNKIKDSVSGKLIIDSNTKKNSLMKQIKDWEWIREVSRSEK